MLSIYTYLTLHSRSTPVCSPQCNNQPWDRKSYMAIIKVVFCSTVWVPNSICAWQKQTNVSNHHHYCQQNPPNFSILSMLIRGYQNQILNYPWLFFFLRVLKTSWDWGIFLVYIKWRGFALNFHKSIYKGSYFPWFKYCYLQTSRDRNMRFWDDTYCLILINSL